MDHVVGLRCTVCGISYEPKPGRYVCDTDAGTLDVEYDYQRIATVFRPENSNDLTMWRFRALLPVAANTPVPPLPVGGTPLVRAGNSEKEFGLGELWIKDEGRQATGSLKDRASTMAVVKAWEEGATVVTTASTGNAAAALAAVCAAAGMKAVIFVPASAPEGKLAQLLAFGAKVVLVEGTYTDAYELSQRAAGAFGWYNRNTGYNPYVGEGKKTVGLEIIEQLGWQSPDSVLVGVGDGSIIGGVHKGFRDGLALGWISSIPRLIGVQAAGSDYLVQAWESGENVATKPAIKAQTVADSISADLPRDRVKAMKAVVDTGGAFVRIEDSEILAAIPHMAAQTGVFAEPAAAAAFAGIAPALAAGHLRAGERVVVISTGTGLKDIASALRAVAERGVSPRRVPSNVALSDLEQML